MRASADDDKYLLRLPSGMKDAIAERAAANGRSMNSEVVAAIEQHLSRSTFADLCDRVSKLEQQINREGKPQ